AENFFAEEGVVMQKRMELGSNEAVKQAVAGGLGIAILSAITLRAEIMSGDLATLDVKRFPLERQWYVVHAQGKHLTPVARAFKEGLLRQPSST
ncbi:MAG: LysR substrate-binding domain-containing protein, partial [Acidiferrobacter sp.]